MPIEIQLSPLIDATEPIVVLGTAWIAFLISVLLVLTGCAFAVAVIQRNPDHDSIDRALFAFI